MTGRYWCVPQAAASQSSEPAPLRRKVDYFFSQNKPARGAVNDRVPHALQRQHHCAGQIETEIGPFGVYESVDAVDAARCPGNQDRDRKDE